MFATLTILLALTVSVAAQRIDGGVRIDGAMQGTPVNNPVFTGQMLSADGTGAAPMYSFTSEATLGFYRVSAGKAGISGALQIVNGLTWSVDGAADIGATATGRPNNAYVKVGVYSPFIVGGTAAGSTLDLRSTSGDCSGTPTATGTQFSTGNNGATVAFKIQCNGLVTLNNPSMTANGQLIISAAQPMAFQGVGTTGNASLSYMAIYDSNGTTRRGYLGDASASDTDIYVVAETGFLQLSGSSGIKATSPITIGANTAIGATASKLIQINDGANATGAEISVGTPALGTCTAGTLTSGSLNFAGQYTGNTSSSCVINFGTPNFTNTPFCFAMSTASTTHPRISAASNSSITVTGGVSGETIQYFCAGRIGT